MKKHIKQLFAAILAFIMLLSPMHTVIAAEQGIDDWFIPKKKTYYATDENISQNFTLWGVSSLKAVKKLKSSNPKVASVEKFKYGDTVYVGVTPKKPGKTTVSFQVKYKGKTYKIRVAATVKKYSSPFSSFKIGKKDLTKKLEKNSQVEFPVKKTLKNQKVSYKLKKGWESVSISYYKSADGSDGKMVENNNKITLKKKKQFQMGAVDKNGNWIDLFVFFR